MGYYIINPIDRIVTAALLKFRTLHSITTKPHVEVNFERGVVIVESGETEVFTLEELGFTSSTKPS